MRAGNLGSLITGMAVMALASAGAVEASDPTRFVQDQFCISFWVDPPVDANMEEYYAQIAEANFTVVLGSSHARRPEAVARQLSLCEQHGLRAIVTIGGTGPKQLPDSSACWGYLLKDEPKAGDFEHLRRTVDQIRLARPGRLAYINLYPSHATPRHWGAPTYEEYVGKFLSTVGVDVLCFDRYPLIQPDADERDGYLENLAVIRKHALIAGIPFWNFFNIIPYGRHEDPTESQVRWQVFTSLAYGAKGVLYFCYWTPKGREFPKGGAIITADGRKTWHYDQAKRTNAVLKNLGPTLMKLTSTGVCRIKTEDDSSRLLDATPIRRLSKGEYLVGTFKHQDGRRAVLLNNYQFAYSAWPTVEFRAKPGNVVEVDPASGREIPVVDDSPDMEGLQLSLMDGGGRLFLTPSQD